MNKKILFCVLFSVLFLSGFMICVNAANDDLSFWGGGDGSMRQRRLSDEEREYRLKKMDLLTFDDWKSRELNRINSVTEEEFNQMKELKKAILERGCGRMPMRCMPF